MVTIAVPGFTGSSKPFLLGGTGDVDMLFVVVEVLWRSLRGVRWAVIAPSMVGLVVLQIWAKLICPSPDLLLPGDGCSLVACDGVCRPAVPVGLRFGLSGGNTAEMTGMVQKEKRAQKFGSV